MRKHLNRIIALIVVLFLLVLFSVIAVYTHKVQEEREDIVILLAGDSRSSTDYTFYKDILENKTGCTVLVEGASGMKASYNASDEYIEHIASLKHDVSIWLVGGNDTGSSGSIGTFSNDSELARMGELIVDDSCEEYFISQIDTCMKKYKEKCNDSSNNKTRPVMIFCTDLPQQRDSIDSQWSQKENWERKRLAIIECCEKNGVECLDLYELCNFDMSKEPMYHEPTDKEHDFGVYYMDGLHPNPKGIDIITDFEVEKMKELGILSD